MRRNATRRKDEEEESMEVISFAFMIKLGKLIYFHNGP